MDSGLAAARHPGMTNLAVILNLTHYPGMRSLDVTAARAMMQAVLGSPPLTVPLGQAQSTDPFRLVKDDKPHVLRHSCVPTAGLVLLEPVGCGNKVPMSEFASYNSDHGRSAKNAPGRSDIGMMIGCGSIKMEYVGFEFDGSLFGCTSGNR